MAHNLKEPLGQNPEPPPQGQQVVYYMPAPEDPYGDDEINLLDYWRVLVQYKWLILLVMILATGAATTAALIATPVFRAEVMMVPADDESSGGGLAAMAGQFGGLASLAGIDLGKGGGQTQKALATLRSRAFTTQFIKDQGLMPVLYEEVWDAKAGRWMVEDPEDAPTDWNAFKSFDGIRQIDEDSKTGMITLAIEWKDPEQAAQWANALVARINAHSKREAIQEAERSIAYLNDQLRETSVVEMQQSIYRLIEAQTKNIMLANVRDEYAFKVIDPAVVPEEKVKPKRKLMVVLGGMVGLMLGVFLAFLLSFIKNQREQSRAAIDAG